MGSLFDYTGLTLFLIFSFGLGVSYAWRRNNLLGIFSILVSVAVFFAFGSFIQLSFLSAFFVLLLPTFLIALSVILIFQNRMSQTAEVTGVEIEKEKNKMKKSSSPFKVELKTNKGKKIFMQNISRGVAIFGSSGSGKSESPIRALINHFSQNEFSGVINDFKEFELSEMAYPFFKRAGIPFYVFAISDPQRSVRINPIHPDYIQSENEVNGLVKSLLANLKGSAGSSDGTSAFFESAAESLLAGVIWRLRTDFPDKCNLPYVIALLLDSENLHDPKRPYGKLIRFLEQNVRAKFLASVFITGAESEKQTAALFSTVADGLRKLFSPETFYLLSGNELPLNLNAEDNRSVLALVNSPGTKQGMISPINAMVMEACFGQMAERNRKPSFILLDEAPTIKIMSLAQRIATLRSFNISFIYCMQDKIQGVAQAGGKDHVIKEILTNLSTQFMGKVNDPDTADFYEKYFEKIKVDNKSISKASGWSSKGDTRVTVSKKDEAKVKGFEFMKFKQGEFVMFDSGNDQRFTFHYTPVVKEMPPLRRSISPAELETHFYHILEDAKLIMTN